MEGEPVVRGRAEGAAGPASEVHPAQMTRARVVRTGVGALAGALLAACNPVGQAGPPPGSEPAGRVVMWARSAFRFDEDTGGDIVKEYQKLNPKVQVVPEVLVEDPFAKLVAASAAGTAPDVCHVQGHQVQEPAAAGMAASLDKYLKASRLVKQADLWPSLVRDVVWKGQQYGIPFAPDIAIMMGQTAAVRGAGLSPEKPPATWEEFEEQLRRMYREESPGKAARIGFGPAGIQPWMVAFWQLGGETLSPDGTKVTINNEKGIKALEWIETLVKIQGGNDAVLSLTGQYLQNWINGSIGYWWANVAAPEQDNNLKEAIKGGLQFNFGYFPVPKGGRRANYGGGHAFVVSTQSKAPEGAWGVLEHLSNEQNNLKFAVRYNRIPVRVKTAQSDAYTHNDPRFKLAVQEMEHRRYVIAAPGGSATVTPFVRITTDVLTGAKSIRDALQDTEKLAQQELDKWQR